MNKFKMKYLPFLLIICLSGCMKINTCKEYININDKAWTDLYCRDIIKAKIETAKYIKKKEVFIPKKCIERLENK